MAASGSTPEQDRRCNAWIPRPASVRIRSSEGRYVRPRFLFSFSCLLGRLFQGLFSGTPGEPAGSRLAASQPKPSQGFFFPVGSHASGLRRSSSSACVSLATPISGARFLDLLWGRVRLCCGKSHAARRTSSQREAAVFNPHPSHTRPPFRCKGSPAAVPSPRLN